MTTDRIKINEFVAATINEQFDFSSDPKIIMDAMKKNKHLVNLVERGDLIALCAEKFPNMIGIVENLPALVIADQGGFIMWTNKNIYRHNLT